MPGRHALRRLLLLPLVLSACRSAPESSGPARVDAAVEPVIALSAAPDVLGDGPPAAEAPARVADAEPTSAVPDAEDTGPAAPAPRLAGRLVVPGEVVADRPFEVALAIENAGTADVTLRLAAKERDSSLPGTLRLESEAGVLVEAPFPSDLPGATPDGVVRFEVAAGGEAELPLGTFRAPTAAGGVRVRLTLSLVDEADRRIELETPPVEVEVTWTGLKVVHIGDSLAAGPYGRRLGDMVRAAGGEYRLEGWEGAGAPRWLGSDRLTRVLRDFAPDIVFVTLGANEFDLHDPAAYLHWWDRLAERISPRRCFWIGPPRLEGVDEFVEEARGRTGACPFFDSRPVAVPNAGRQRDHLGTARAEDWAAAVWAWLGAQWRP